MSHTTPQSELDARLAQAQTAVKVGGVYRHFRTRDLYKVLGFGLCEWNEQPAVLYQRVGVANPPTWIRPLHGEDGWLTPATAGGAEVVRFRLED